MNICEHLTATARLFPDKEAIVFEGQRLTFKQLDQMSVQAAKRLVDADVMTGDRVAIMLPNVPAFVVWYYATLRVGAIAVSVSTRLAEQEVAFVAADCGAKVFVADQPTLVRNAAQFPECIAKSFETSETGDRCDGELLAKDTHHPSTWVEADPSDPALILYTSGTTGFAKGATLSHLNVRSNVHAFNHLCQMQSDDRVLLAVPLFHCFGQNALLNSVFNIGGTIIMQRKLDLSEAKRLIADEQVTQLYGAPTMFQLFHESWQPEDLRTVRYCFSAAATLPIQVSRCWQEKFGMPIYEGYGLTETSPFASYNHRLQFIMGSIGTPIDSVEMKIVDTDTGEDCPPGELGEIAIRGPNVMLGYWNRPEDTARAIRDGWFHSGDIGRTDERGFFYIVDRVKDMIVVGGLKVYPAEVERILLDHAAVSQVAVVGFPDDVFGEQVVAFVVASSAASNRPELATEIKQHGRIGLANYKVPKHVVFIDELPRNPSGKVLKTQLREYDLSQPITAGSPSEVADLTELRSLAPSSSALELPRPTLRDSLLKAHAAGRQRVAISFLQDRVHALTGADERPDADCRFLDAGLDSLMVVELSSQIQLEVGTQREIPATLVFDYPRIRDLAEFLVSSLSPGEVSRSSLEQPPSASTEANTQSAELQLCQQVESMSEEEALDELMRELDNESS